MGRPHTGLSLFAVPTHRCDTTARSGGQRPGQGRTGVPATEAARLLGLNYEAVRKRIKRGTLPAYKEGDRWYVLLDGAPDTADDLVGSTSGELRNSFVTPAEVERAIETTASKYVADFAGLYDRVSAELDRRYQAEIAAKDQTIAVQALALTDLRAEVEALRHQAVPQPFSVATTLDAAWLPPMLLHPLRGFGSVCGVG